MGLPPALDRVHPELDELTELFTRAGFELYLVGGTVRDTLLEIPHDDLDFCTNAQPEQIKELISDWAEAVWSQGEAFGTIGCARSGHKFEITTFRADVYEPHSRKPAVEFGDNVEVDLSRRDFTVNALAMRLPDGVLVDPFGGAVDLMNKVLRTPIAPTESFSDDPLRMMRAARFIAGYGLVPQPDLVKAIGDLRHRLAIVSAERIRDELSKLLVVKDPSNGLWFLSETGLSDEFLPELNAMKLEQDPVQQHKDVLAHTIAVVCNTRPELRVRLAALMHDIGKPKTRAFGPDGVTFHHHEVVGARMTAQRLRALKFPGELVEEVRKLVFLHLRIHTYVMGWSDSAVRRYVRDAGDLLDDLNHLVRCDCTTRNKEKAQELQARVDELEERIEVLREEEELASLRPALDGNQIMRYLGLDPSPVVGEALDFLMEIRLDEGEISEEQAYARLAAWAKARGLHPAR